MSELFGSGKRTESAFRRHRARSHRTTITILRTMSRCHGRPAWRQDEAERQDLTNILVGATLVQMRWSVVLKESVVEDLRWFGSNDGRLLLREAAARLAADPLTESQNLKVLRPNPVAARATVVRQVSRAFQSRPRFAGSDDRSGRREAWQLPDRSRRGVYCPP